MLGMACQDGTLQLRSWGKEGFTLPQHVSRHEVMVDGPILPLQFYTNSTDGSLRLLVGSLCGYVCQIKYNKSKSEWQDPTMVVDNVQDERIDAEDDSVETVHGFEHFVAVGTHFGRLLLYECNCGVQNDYFSLVWECILPYSIHGIVGYTNIEASVLKLIVTTRRTFHIFECPYHAPSPRSTTTRTREYSVALAQERLLQLMNDDAAEKAPKTETPPSNAALDTECESTPGDATNIDEEKSSPVSYTHLTLPTKA